MNFFKLFNYLIICGTVSLYAQTNLSGYIGGMTLGREGNPFIVSDNITIPAGKTVTVLDSCIFLFKPFTGIIVEGCLEVKGTAEKPVIFTSINNPAFNSAAPQPPDPFDWNGISIETKAHGVRLSHFTLSYSVYGIKSKRDDVVITHGSFVNNGQFHFTIHNEIQPVTDTLPFNYQLTADSQRIVPVTSTPGSWKRPIAFVTTIGGCAGLGAMGYFINQKNNYHNKYLAADTLPDLDFYIGEEGRVARYAWISGIAGGILLGSGIALFSSDIHDRRKSTVTIYPIIGPMYGMLFEVRF